MHNGIIENADELRAKLIADGVEFRSQTDTEVVPHLIAAAFAAGAPDLERAVSQALRRVVGAYGIAVLDADHPDRIVVARNGSPVLRCSLQEFWRFPLPGCAWRVFHWTCRVAICGCCTRC